MLKIISFSRFLMTQGKKNNIVNLSAQMSFRILSAFIPFLMLLYNFINWFSASINQQFFAALAIVLPKSIMNYVNFAMENATAYPVSTSTNLVIGFFLLYISVSAMHSLITSLNRIFGQDETRGFAALWIQSIIYLFLFLLIIMFTLFFYLFGIKLFGFIFSALDLSNILAIFITLFSLIYIIIIPALIFTLIYMFAPKNHLSFSNAFPGGLFVSIGWIVILFLYGIFAEATINFKTFFLNLQGPFSLFFVVYLISFTLTLGGVVNLYSSQNEPAKITESEERSND